MISVACVYWKGKFRGRENIFSSKWVRILFNMVYRNLPDDAFQFFCLTNVPEEFENDKYIQAIPLEHNWRGWWSKIELFKPGLFPDNSRVLYLDLDSIVLKNLNPLFELDSDFIMMESKLKGTQERYDKFENRIKITIYKWSSTTMLWSPSVGYPIYNDFNYEKDSYHFRGDQDWINYKMENVTTFPKNWVGKLRDCEGLKPHKDMIVVAPLSTKILPKKNESAAEKFEWAKKAWR